MASSSNTADAKPAMPSMNDFTHNLQQQSLNQTEHHDHDSPSNNNANENNNTQEEEDEEITLLDRWNEQTLTTKYTVIGATLAMVSSIFFISFWQFILLSFLLIMIVFGVWFSQTNLSVEITVFLAKFFPPSSQAVWDTHKFEWTKRFRDNYLDIYNEYLNFEQNYNYCPQMDDAYPNGSITNWDRKWPTVTLRAYNLDCKVSKYFPKTMALVNHPSNKYLLSHCMFSIIQPDKFIPRHRGPYRGVFRYQLALEVPPVKDAERLYLAVWPETSSHEFWYPEHVPDGEPQKCFWTPGEDFIFDDTCVHEVRNNTVFRRIILFVDVERHDIPWYAKIVHRFFMSIARFLPAIQQVKKVQDKMIEDDVKIDAKNEVDHIDEPNAMRSHCSVNANRQANETNENNENIENNNNTNTNATSPPLSHFHQATVPEVAPYKRARILIERQRKRAELLARQRADLINTLKSNIEQAMRATQATQATNTNQVRNEE